MREVARGEDLPPRHIDTPDPAVRDGAAHERDLQRAGKPHVGDELAAPVQVAPVFLAAQARADALAACLHQSCLIPISFTSLPYFWMSASRIFLNSAGVV